MSRNGGTSHGTRRRRARRHLSCVTASGHGSAITSSATASVNVNGTENASTKSTANHNTGTVHGVGTHRRRLPRIPSVARRRRRCPALDARTGQSCTLIAQCPRQSVKSSRSPSASTTVLPRYERYAVRNLAIFDARSHLAISPTPLLLSPAPLRQQRHRSPSPRRFRLNRSHSLKPRPPRLRHCPLLSRPLASGILL